MDTENVNTIADDTVEILSDYNDPPEWFNNDEGEPTRVLIRPDGTPKIDLPNLDQTRREIMRVMRFESPGKPTKANPNPLPVDRNIPDNVVRNLMGARDLPYPVLEGITSAPQFVADGSIRLSPGYDPATRTYLYPVGGVDFRDASLDRDPTSAEAAAAVARLNDIYGQFPYVDDADWTHLLALLLAQVSGQFIEGRIPMVSITKPVQGTGASMLAKAATAPFTVPTGVAGMASPKNDEEFQKALLARHLKGDRYALFDNATGIIGGETLAQAVTEPFVDVRLLGTNTMVRARSPRYFLVTMNGAQFDEDMIRRVIPIRLDPKTDRPEHRADWRYELPAAAWENRVPIVRATLTLWRAWWAAGRPLGAYTLGSFQNWAETIGGVLDVAGIKGFLENAEDFREQGDAIGDVWRSVIDAWWETFGSDPVFVRELATLPAVAEGFGVKFHDEKDKQKFGMKLRTQQDRQYGKLVIRQSGKRRGSQTYALEHREGVEKKRTRARTMPYQGDVSGPEGGQGDLIDLNAHRTGSA
jgi:hypothetical protein